LFEFSSIELYHQQLQKGTITCRQVVEHYLEQIGRSKRLNAFISVYAAEALERAAYLDLQRQQGKPMAALHGVVTGLKDVIAYRGHRLSASSRILDGFTSIYSATATQKLIDAEAIIIGNCNCDEFAMGSTNENSAYGNVLNARDETRVPGGSSGGSAVSVQAGLCMIALGSDTGGSVRQPADFCGIVGLKPSYGRISRHGLIAYASSFDQIGIFAKNVPDAARILTVIAGPDQYDSTVRQEAPPDYFEEHRKLPSGTRRFAYFKEALDHPHLDPEIGQSIKQTITLLSSQGHLVEPVSFGYLDYIVPTYYVLTTAEASSNLARFDGVRYGHRTRQALSDLAKFYKLTRSEGFGKEVKRRIMLGTFVLSAGYHDAYFRKAQQVRRLLAENSDRIFENYDFLLMPTSPTTAFTIGEKMNDPVSMYLADIFTVMANLVGCPAISLPLYTHSSGLPFSLQVMAKNFNEVSLLRISRELMEPAADQN
jgi:aspartyl-tRNA(Asn)/glutamyl-tRNA(Gln) amidotransferase subunit A